MRVLLRSRVHWLLLPALLSLALLLAACGDTAVGQMGYCDAVLNGVTHNHSDSDGSILAQTAAPGGLVITVNAMGGGYSTSVLVPSSAVGSYPVDGMTATVVFADFGTIWTALDGTINLTSVSGVGGEVVGDFDVTLVDGNLNPGTAGADFAAAWDQ